jgi:hypothetical protein
MSDIPLTPASPSFAPADVEVQDPTRFAMADHINKAPENLDGWESLKEWSSEQLKDYWCSEGFERLRAWRKAGEEIMVCYHPFSFQRQ